MRLEDSVKFVLIAIQTTLIVGLSWAAAGPLPEPLPPDDPPPEVVYIYLEPVESAEQVTYARSTPPPVKLRYVVFYEYDIDVNHDDDYVRFCCYAESDHDANKRIRPRPRWSYPQVMDAHLTNHALDYRTERECDEEPHEDEEEYKGSVF